MSDKDDDLEWLRSATKYRDEIWSDPDFAALDRILARIEAAEKMREALGNIYSDYVIHHDALILEHETMSANAAIAAYDAAKAGK